MAQSRYKLMREDNSKGFWITEQDVLNLIKICDKRHKYYYNLLVEAFEFLEDAKFNKAMIQAETKGIREVTE